MDSIIKFNDLVKVGHAKEDEHGLILPFQGGRFRLTRSLDVVDTGVVNRYPNPIDTFLSALAPPPLFSDSDDYSYKTHQAIPYPDFAVEGTMSGEEIVDSTFLCDYLAYTTSDGRLTVYDHVNSNYFFTNIYATYASYSYQTTLESISGVTTNLTYAVLFNSKVNGEVEFEVLDHASASLVAKHSIMLPEKLGKLMGCFFSMTSPTNVVYLLTRNASGKYQYSRATFSGLEDELVLGDIQPSCYDVHELLGVSRDVDFKITCKHGNGLYIATDKGDTCFLTDILMKRCLYNYSADGFNGTRLFGVFRRVGVRMLDGKSGTWKDSNFSKAGLHIEATQGTPGAVIRKLKTYSQIPLMFEPDVYHPLRFDGYSKQEGLVLNNLVKDDREIKSSGVKAVNLSNSDSSIILHGPIEKGKSYSLYFNLMTSSPDLSPGEMAAIINFKDVSGADVMVLGVDSSNKLCLWSRGEIHPNYRSNTTEACLAVDIAWDDLYDKHRVFYGNNTMQQVNDYSDILFDLSSVASIEILSNELTAAKSTSSAMKSAVDCVSDFTFFKKKVPANIYGDIYRLTNGQSMYTDTESDLVFSNLSNTVPLSGNFSQLGIMTDMPNGLIVASHVTRGLEFYKDVDEMLFRTSRYVITEEDLGFNKSMRAFAIDETHLMVTSDFVTYKVIKMDFAPAAGSYSVVAHQLLENKSYKTNMFDGSFIVNKAIFNRHKNCFVVLGSNQTSGDSEFLEIAMNEDFTPGDILFRRTIEGSGLNHAAEGIPCYIGDDTYLFANTVSTALYMVSPKRNIAKMISTTSPLSSTESRGLAFHRGYMYTFSLGNVSRRGFILSPDYLNLYDGTLNTALGLSDSDMNILVGSEGPDFVESVDIEEEVVGPLEFFNIDTTGDLSSVTVSVPSMSNVPLSLGYLYALAVRPIIAPDEFLLGHGNLSVSFGDVLESKNVLKPEEVKWSINADIVFGEDSRFSIYLPELSIVSDSKDMTKLCMFALSDVVEGTHRKDIVARTYHGYRTSAMRAEMVAVKEGRTEFGAIDGTYMLTNKESWEGDDLLYYPITSTTASGVITDVHNDFVIGNEHITAKDLSKFI